MEKSVKLLGVRVDNVSRAESAAVVEQYVNDSKFHHIVTVNQEILLKAEKNAQYRNIINSSDLNIPDTMGMHLGFWSLGRIMKARIPGADLMLDLLRIAAKKKLGVFLAASTSGLSSWQETRDAILKLFPDLEIGGDNIDPNNEEYRIPNSTYAILLCNFGAPQQEIFCARQNRGTIRLAVGVGGSFDFLTGKIRRAPLWMRNIGMEWFWRFVQEPRYRWKRVWNAVVVYPIKLLVGTKQNIHTW